MRYLVLSLFIFLLSSADAQSVKFIWINDTEITATEADSTVIDLFSAVKNTETEFIFHTGNITFTGSNKQFEAAKKLLDNTGKKYFLLQGTRDVEWSESSGLKFTDLWKNQNFSFKTGNYFFIFLNSSLLFRNSAHISPESLNWLRSKLNSIPDNSKILLFLHHGVDEIDNWIEANNILSNYNLSAIFTGSGNRLGINEFNGVPVFGGLTLRALQDSVWQYVEGEISGDSLFLFKITANADTSTFYQNKLFITNLPTVDSLKIYEHSAKVLWNKELNTTLIAEPLVLENNIITATYDGLIQCFDFNGKLLWEFDAFGNIAGMPAAKDGYLVAATLQGDLHTIDINTGEQIQSIGFDNPITSGLLVIDYEGSRELMIPKQTESKAAVIFATSDGTIMCYDVETLQEYWRNETPKGLVNSTPVITGNKIIFGAWDSYLYCIDSREGWLIWKWHESKNVFNSPAKAPPVTYGNSVFIVTPMQHTVKIDAMLGRTIWKSDKYDVNASIGITNDGKRLLLKGINGNFYNPYSKSGKGGLTYKIKFRQDFLPIAPIEVDGIYFFGTSEGNIYRIRKKKFKKILFAGNAPMHNIRYLGNNKFFTSNYDGKLIMFEYNEK